MGGPQAQEASPVSDDLAAQAAIAEWEARLHANEVQYWAQHLDEFERRLARLRYQRLGDARSLQMMGDVLKELTRTQGEEIAGKAHARLLERWHDGAPDAGEGR